MIRIFLSHGKKIKYNQSHLDIGVRTDNIPSLKSKETKINLTGDDTLVLRK